MIDVVVILLTSQLFCWHKCLSEIYY